MIIAKSKDLPGTDMLAGRSFDSATTILNAHRVENRGCSAQDDGQRENGISKRCRFTLKLLIAGYHSLFPYGD
jgi:hypothetical protein